jgi:hypothetical protein
MLVVTPVTSFNAVGHREKLCKRMATDRGPVFVAAVGSWPSLALLFTYRAEVGVGGGKKMVSFRRSFSQVLRSFYVVLSERKAGR